MKSSISYSNWNWTDYTKRTDKITVLDFWSLCMLCNYCFFEFNFITSWRYSCI